MQLETVLKNAYYESGTRYYYLSLEKDLLGDWTITRANGSIGKRLGQIRHLAEPSFENAVNCFLAMKEKRLHRGYHLVSLV